jgi:hypothetical protein
MLQLPGELTDRMLRILVDNVCIESLSIDLTRPMLDAAGRSVVKLSDKIDEQVFFSNVVTGAFIQLT